MKKIALALLFLLITALPVSAAVTEIKVEKDFSNNLITIRGKAEPNENIAFQILPDGVSLSDFALLGDKAGTIAFVYEVQADKNGDFSVTAGLKGNDTQVVKYDIFSATEDITKPIEAKDDVSFANSTYYNTQLTALKGATTPSGFVSIATANLEAFGYDDAINSIIPINDTLNFMYNELKNTGKTLDSGKSVENVWLYKNSAAILGLNNKKIATAYEYVENIIKGDSTLEKYWKQYVLNAEREKYLFGKISGKSITSIADLKTKIIEGLILTATKDPDGYMSLQPLYSDYKNVIGLSSVSSINSVYSSVGAKEYESITALRDAYNVAVNATASGDSSSSISIGGGQTVTAGGSPSAVISVPNNVSYNPQTSLSLGFQDLSAFEWSYPSISILHEKGIVSGVSETQFSPSKQVKREEFIKMIVCAMGLETNLGDRFSDVDNSAWYAPYVYTAYNNNLVNGITDKEFGVSKDISRQDMAVMIYNAIKKKGYVPAGAELAFDDKDGISDYAKEAVAELSNLGIINGMGNGRFAPTERATRAQSAVIIERALKYLEQ